MSLTLEYELVWDERSATSAEVATWGRLSVRLGQTLLWGATKQGSTVGIHWTWVDLLEHLAEIWPWLLWEEGWPTGPNFRDPAEFLTRSEAWLSGLPEADAVVHEERLFEFRHRHDLALAIQGKVVPPLWIVREGRNAWIVGSGVSAVVEMNAVRSTLVRLAEQIVARLATVQDERAKQAIEFWSERFSWVDLPQAAAIAVGVKREQLEELAAGNIGEVFELDPQGSAESFEANELVAAARMAAATTDSSVVQAILSAMRDVPLRSTPTLDGLSAAAVKLVNARRGEGLKPALLGYEVAAWLRSELGLPAGAPAEPDALLGTWNVHLGEFTSADDEIEAVACWGRRHGPAILINPSGRHAGVPFGRRATLAHEIAHLLIDRSAALPVAEVLGGNVTHSLEQRANAFAAELLMPKAVAGEAFHKATTSAAETLEHLSQHYRVSREIVAWQAYNSGYPMDQGTYFLLRKQVTYPNRFLWKVATQV